MLVPRALKIPPQCWRRLRAATSGSKNRHVISTRSGVDGMFRLPGSPTLLPRNIFGKNNVLLRLVDVEAEQLLLVSANAVPRKALNNVTKRTEIDAFNKMRVETPGYWFPKLATLLDGGGQAGPVCSQGNQQLGPNGSRSVSQNSLPGFGT